jgi:hypothetical protein
MILMFVASRITGMITGALSNLHHCLTGTHLLALLQPLALVAQLLISWLTAWQDSS